MKYLLLCILMAALFATANANWKDCNLPANQATCQAEFAQSEADRLAAWNALTGKEKNQSVCQDTNGSPCGGGGGGK